MDCLKSQLTWLDCSKANKMGFCINMYLDFHQIDTATQLPNQSTSSESTGSHIYMYQEECYAREYMKKVSSGNKRAIFAQSVTEKWSTKEFENQLMHNTSTQYYSQQVCISNGAQYSHTYKQWTTYFRKVIFTAKSFCWQLLIFVIKQHQCTKFTESGRS